MTNTCCYSRWTFLFAMLYVYIMISIDDRHVRGEDLQGLNLEELQKLEKSIETSLCRVAEEKVCVVCSCLDSEDRLISEYIYICWKLCTIPNTHVSTSICFRGVKLLMRSMLASTRSTSNIFRIFRQKIIKIIN